MFRLNSPEMSNFQNSPGMSNNSVMISTYNQINNYLMSLGIQLPRNISMLFNGSLSPKQIYNQLSNYLRAYAGIDISHPTILNNIYQILNSVVSYQAALPQQRVAQTVLYSNNNYGACMSNLPFSQQYVCNIFKETDNVDGDYYNYFYNS
jgi:hypothetical protein